MFCHIYLTACSNCREQYVRSAINFKQKFRISKSDIKINKQRCGTAGHFNNQCCSPNTKHAYLKVKIIEHVFNNNQCTIEDLLRKQEINNINDLYSMKKKGYRK